MQDTGDFSRNFDAGLFPEPKTAGIVIKILILEKESDLCDPDVAAFRQNPVASQLTERNAVLKSEVANFESR